MCRIIRQVYLSCLILIMRHSKDITGPMSLSCAKKRLLHKVQCCTILKKSTVAVEMQARCKHPICLLVFYSCVDYECGC